MSKRARDTLAPIVVGEVVTLRPALLKTSAAGNYIGLSSSWMNAARADDVKALREGLTPTGPKWIVIGGSSVFYRLDDLDGWISAQAVERGVCAFANRGGPTK